MKILENSIVKNLDNLLSRVLMKVWNSTPIPVRNYRCLLNQLSPTGSSKTMTVFVGLTAVAAPLSSCLRIEKPLTKSNAF